MKEKDKLFGRHSVVNRGKHSMSACNYLEVVWSKYREGTCMSENIYNSMWAP